MKKVFFLMCIIFFGIVVVNAEDAIPDIQIENIYVDNNEVEKIPAKNDGYYFKNAECTNGVSALFDEENYELVLNNISSSSSCKVYFTSKEEEKGNTVENNNKNESDGIENPKTGAFINNTIITISLIITIIATVFLIRKNKFFRI